MKAIHFFSCGLVSSESCILLGFCHLNYLLVTLDKFLVYLAGAFCSVISITVQISYCKSATPGRLPAVPRYRSVPIVVLDSQFSGIVSYLVTCHLESSDVPQCSSWSKGPEFMQCTLRILMKQEPSLDSR